MVKLIANKTVRFPGLITLEAGEIYSVANGIAEQLLQSIYVTKVTKTRKRRTPKKLN